MRLPWQRRGEPDPALDSNIGGVEEDDVHWRAAELRDQVARLHERHRRADLAAVAQRSAAQSWELAGREAIAPPGPVVPFRPGEHGPRVSPVQAFVEGRLAQRTPPEDPAPDRTRG